MILENSKMSLESPKKAASTESFAMPSICFESCGERPFMSSSETGPPLAPTSFKLHITERPIVMTGRPFSIFASILHFTL